MGLVNELGTTEALPGLRATGSNHAGRVIRMLGLVEGCRPGLFHQSQGQDFAGSCIDRKRKSKFHNQMAGLESVWKAHLVQSWIRVTVLSNSRGRRLLQAVGIQWKSSKNARRTLPPHLQLGVSSHASVPRKGWESRLAGNISGLFASQSPSTMHIF